MIDELLRKRGRRLEESFFAEHNRNLLKKLEQRWRDEEKRQAMAKEVGIDDREVIDQMIALEIDAETFAALTLMPLIRVAWADGKMNDEERRAILAAAEKEGISPKEAAFELLEDWLRRPPDANLVAAWKNYAASLIQSLEPNQRLTLRDCLIDRTTAVAQSAGGFLGFGSKISREEKKVLDEVKQDLSSGAG